MRLGILHLSDLHFREGTNIAMERVHKIGPALISADGLIDACVVAVTGDIAFSGKKTEYNQAHQFFNSLIQLLTSKYGAHNVGVFMVPGNHDCDFSGTAEVRSILLDGLESRLENFDPQGDLARTLLCPQSEFFNFDSQWADSSEPGQPWLYRAKAITFQATVIRARCYNTAFASRLSERQGQIYFPTQIAPSEGKSDSKDVLTLSLFHHPYPWLEANNGLKFRRHIENSSQIVLTGHMHSQAIYTKNNLEGESVDYQEGAAFQTSDSLESGFNVVVCDLDLQRHRRFEFKWVDASYVPSKTEDWNPFVANKALKAAFENTEDYANDLHDAGAGFTHPRKSKLVLSDIFVPPDFGRFDFERRVEGRGALTPIQSGEVENFLLAHDRLLIVGGEQSGKTTLAKTSYVALQERGFVPLCISGSDLNAATESRLLEVIRSAFHHQYRAERFEDYKQLDVTRKALILDDLHRSKLNFAGKTKIIELASRLFGKSVIFTGEFFRVEEIGSQQTSFTAFQAFEFCEIREFGYFLRSKLIAKWNRLGREFIWDASEHAHELEETEKLVSSLLGKNLLPASPIIVLSILQVVEANKAASTPSGAYGYVWESLITSALTKGMQDTRDLDLKYTLLSRIAFKMFSSEKKSLTAHEIEQVKQQYFEKYSIRIEPKILNDLAGAQVLSISSGEYSFHYNYIYYYFVARYMHEGLRDETERPLLERKLNEMADQVYYLEYARILMFVLYLTRDVRLIQFIMHNANRIYGEHTPCDFEQDVNFINRLYKEAPKILVSSSDLEKNREQYKKDLDKETESNESGMLQVADEKIEYDDNLDDILKINIAFKNLELLGQVMKNFFGSLPKELKSEITLSCYRLGLRLLHALFKLAEGNLEQFRNFVAELIREHRPSLTESELAKTTDEAVIWLTRRAAFGVLKRVSHSVGLEILQETYREVLESEGYPTSFRLIDLSVKLDHFAQFPGDEVTGLWDDLRKNSFSQTIVRDMVAHHGHLFGLKGKVGQRIGEKLGIKITTPQLRDPRTKRLKE